jgi:hypothetical protein
VPPPWRTGARSAAVARGFNRSLHVSNEHLTPDRGPLYVVQTLVEVPATVIAQQTGDGSIRVLAAFANNGMSLRRHVETVVKPWINAHVRWDLARYSPWARKKVFQLGDLKVRVNTKSICPELAMAPSFEQQRRPLYY